MLARRYPGGTRRADVLQLCGGGRERYKTPRSPMGPEEDVKKSVAHQSQSMENQSRSHRKNWNYFFIERTRGVLIRINSICATKWPQFGRSRRSAAGLSSLLSHLFHSG